MYGEDLQNDMPSLSSLFKNIYIVYRQVVGLMIKHGQINLRMDFFSQAGFS